MKVKKTLQQTSAGIIVSKPFILIFWAAVMLLTSIGGYLLPVFRSVVELGSLSGSNAIETVMSFVQLLYEYTQRGTLVIISSVILLMVLFLMSVLGSVIFSGYFNVLNNIVTGKTQKSPFKEGIRQFFNRIFTMNFIFSVLSLVLFLILIAAMVPALVITNAITSKGKEMIPAVLFVDTVTGLVFVFAVLFFRVYMFYWFPAVINGVKKPFKTAKEIVNRNFWRIAGIFLLFDGVFLSVQWFLTRHDDNLFFVLLKWIFLTCFFALFSTYVFVSYRKYSRNNFKNISTGTIRRKKKGKKKNEKI